MSQYLFIESQDPFEDRGAEAYLATALDLCRGGSKVTVIFVENGCHATRKGARLDIRDALRDAGATLQVDELALKERGIASGNLAPGVEVGSVDRIVDLLTDPETKAVWH